MVVRFLNDLPRSFTVPILLTQHMPTPHVPYFAEMLAAQAGRPVRLARDGDLVEPGAVYVACDGRHMTVSRKHGRLVIVQNDGPEEHHCRPAVDPLFRSVAEVCGPASLGVVMTGMGSDGAQGAIAMRRSGAPVIAQNKESSVVWGMPGAVAAAGAASELVSANTIAAAVMRWTIQETLARTEGSANE